MKIQAFLTFFLFVFVYGTQAQYLPGFRSGNNAGVLTLANNPANAQGGRYAWDISLFNIQAFTGNTNANIKVSDFFSELDETYLTNQFLGKTGVGSGLLNIEVGAIGAMFKAGKKLGLGITSRARVWANAIDLDGKLANEIVSGGDGGGPYPFALVSGNNSIMQATAFSDISLSAGYEIMQKGPHLLKGGIALKYLSGVANTSLIASNLRGSVDFDDLDEESYLTGAGGNLSSQLGGIKLEEEFDASSLAKMNGGGLGADLGVVYEFRPQSWLDHDGQLKKGHGKAPYKFRLSASVIDLGSIKFEADTAISKSYNMNIPAGQRLYTTEFASVFVEGVEDLQEDYPNYFTQTGKVEGKYKVKMPATLVLAADYNIGGGWFASLDARLALSSQSGANAMRQYSSVAITPRWETKGLGFYLPATWHQVTGLTVGTALQLGPLFVGSGSLISMLAGGSKQADVFIGVRFGGWNKNKVKQAKTATDLTEKPASDQ